MDNIVNDLTNLVHGACVAVEQNLHALVHHLGSLLNSDGWVGLDGISQDGLEHVRFALPPNKRLTKAMCAP